MFQSVIYRPFLSSIQLVLILSLSFTIPSLVSANPSATQAGTGISGWVGKIAEGNALSGGSTISAGQIIPKGSIFVGEHSFSAGENLLVNGKPIIAPTNGYYPTEGSRVVAGSDLTAQGAGAQVITPGAAAGGALIQGLFWGVALYAGIKMLGEMLGLGKGTTDALANAALVGGIGGGAVKAAVLYFRPETTAASQVNFLGGSFTPGQLGFGAGVVIAVVVFLVMYKDTKTKVVSYQCLPWEPALGGAKCEECNKNSLQPCSEYRCKSLGQACELVNPGTSEEKCIWKSKNDVTSPTITPWEDALRPTGLRYVPLETRPNARGTRIVSANGDCLDAFTPLEFGITNNEPAQCKIDFRNGNLSTMQFFFGGSNYFVTNHTQKMKLPSGNADGLTLQNDGTFDLYVKCQDANGNVNEDVYVIEYCVKKGPDTTPPVIVDTSITSGSPVRFGANAVPLEVYTQEPAQCKWSRTSKPYDDMENRFTCATAPTQLNGDLSYTCAGNMTGVLDRAENQFYIRCQDYANNTMAQSYPFVLKGSQPLTILETSPNGTLYGATTTVPVTLGVKTDAGAEAGKASCYYSAPATLGEPIKFFATESFTHSQQVDVTAGFHQYSVLCIDAGGNTANRTVNFTMIIDQLAPRVTRVYREEALKVVTNEAAECTYSLTSCTFELDDGIKMQYTRPDVQNQHFVDWKSSLTYYVKCVDKYGNQPDPGECSVVVSPKQFVNATTV